MNLWKHPKSTEYPSLFPKSKQYPRDLIVIDSHYLAHRALWTCGGLYHRGIATGVLFGFLVQLNKILSLFPKSSSVVFAWDSEQSARRSVYVNYKMKEPKTYTQEEIKQREEFRYQINILRPEVLEPLGYSLHIKAEGFEADDIIAGVCKWGSRHPEAVSRTWIVSSDHDLFQLLNWGTMYLPHTKRNFTGEDLKKKWGVSPEQWAQVMAISGCSTDGVPGVIGVGLKTASDYILGKKCRPSIVTAIKRSARMIDRNLKLVQLPFKNANLVPTDFFPVPRKIDKNGIDQVREQFGFRNLDYIL